MFKYEMLLRPASFATLPQGVKWEYVEIPSDLAGRVYDKPIAKNQHGIIATDRALTNDELCAFDLRPVK